VSVIRRPARAGLVAALSVAMTAMTGALAATATASVPPAATPGYVALSGSTLATHAPITGRYGSDRMSVEVALAPRNEAGLNDLLSALYTKGSPSYHRWLAKGQFDKQYGPSAATRTAVGTYLTGYGLSIQDVASPFLVRAVGSSQQVSAAFRTTLSTYHEPGGARFFANSTPVQLPATLSPAVLGVIGLSDTYQSRPADDVVVSSKARGNQPASCETPYPTPSQLEAFVSSSSTSFPFGYGDGPGCSGLTPSQVNSIYGAPNVGPRGKGTGVTVALMEQSGYEASSVTAWAQEFYGPGYTPDLQTVNVDGGPLDPQCPSGDTCPASINGYAEDVEADLDAERELTVAPDIAKVIMYESPNDENGQTELDDYTQIASDDLASTVSSSFVNGECVLSAGFVQSENTVFEQMAAQGQSMLSASGDWGPAACTDYGIDQLAVIDPAAQPWVTGVGGTSFEGWDPDTSATPGYPVSAESAWNADNLCSPSNTVVDGETGYQWCVAPTEIVGGGNAGSGGSSAFWGRPSYQTGQGVNNSYTTYSNKNDSSTCSTSGTPCYCIEAAEGTPCREVPDVSADADTYTGYATSCTGTASLANSQCFSLESKEAVTGWFAVAGTSSASPLWAGIAADMDSYTGGRVGFLNPLLYALFNVDPGKYFNDITGAGQTVTTDGLYPTTPGYDEATGIGTPKVAALITQS
jgi:subtilase family serine protease